MYQPMIQFAPGDSIYFGNLDVEENSQRLSTTFCLLSLLCAMNGFLVQLNVVEVELSRTKCSSPGFFIMFLPLLLVAALSCQLLQHGKW